MFGRVAFRSVGLLNAQRAVTPIARRFISQELKQLTIETNEKLCKPLSVSEARKLGSKGEIVIEDELLLDRYLEELQLAEESRQVPNSINYNMLVYFFAARGSISVVNAILSHLQRKNPSLITERTTESYIDGLVQFGDFDRAHKIFMKSQENETNLYSECFGSLLYGAINAGKFNEAHDIIARAKDQFLPPEIEERMVSKQ